ncbi:MAG: alpha-L-arabinofuranosidase C-terminal domain-containing protein [Lachnospiraceae bacterium]|nr:alpha-L-arabinofuranosidase C-terminal domain-containing protein [Lachnospiraceae bacterium]
MAKLTINENKKLGKINAEIYGQFSEHLGRCIYEGLYVGEDSEIPNVNGMRIDVVNALKDLKIPVLRWPGGCFADEYHWKDGIGPKAERKKMINTNWGGVLEDNSFGTHEFMELCEQLGCKTYINGNVGSGTVQEMSEWIEYMTFDGVSPMSELRKKNGREKPWKVDYFGIGNESWGCGGNMTPDYYGNLYRRYQSFVKDYAGDGNIHKICCGPNADDYHWTEEVLKKTYDHTQKELHGMMDGLSLHYYTVPGDWTNKGSATEFDEKDWYRTIKKALYIEELIEKHSHIMDQYDPEKKIGMIVDEWGCWFDVEFGTNPGFLYQQNTMRDALVACASLNIFNKHCNRVKMANIAQMINVLQAMILTEGNKMLLTPTYYVFHMYRNHQNAELLESDMEISEIGTDDDKIPDLSESVSMDEAGNIHITLGNLSPVQENPIEIRFFEKRAEHILATILTGPMKGHNTFEEPEAIRETEFTDFVITDSGNICLTIPPCSVLHLEVKS